MIRKAEDGLLEVGRWDRAREITGRFSDSGAGRRFKGLRGVKAKGIKPYAKKNRHHFSHVCRFLSKLVFKFIRIKYSSSRINYQPVEDFNKKPDRFVVKVQFFSFHELIPKWGYLTPKWIFEPIRFETRVATLSE
ncbi:MAG: hypothetical protein PHG36_02665 [Dehalococcoidia bacterium]|nr:hypothetical protein [Dehalococcoidia bacterium]